MEGLPAGQVLILKSWLAGQKLCELIHLLMLLCIFAVVSKEKFCLTFPSLALVELRRSRIVFLLRLCVPGCRKLPGLGNKPLLHVVKGRQQAVSTLGSREGERRGILKAWYTVWSVVLGTGASIANWLLRPAPPAKVCHHRVLASRVTGTPGQGGSWFPVRRQNAFPSHGSE